MSRSIDSQHARRPWNRTVKRMGNRNIRRIAKQAMKLGIAVCDLILPEKKTHGEDQWSWD